MPDEVLPGIPAVWVTAGLQGVIDYHKRKRHPVWNCPSSEEAAAIIAAATPFIVAAERERAASAVEHLGVPGVERRAYEAAARIVREGGTEPS